MLSSFGTEKMRKVKLLEQKVTIADIKKVAPSCQAPMRQYVKRFRPRTGACMVDNRGPRDLRPYNKVNITLEHVDAYRTCQTAPPAQQGLRNLLSS